MTDATPVDYRVDNSTGCWVWQRYRDRNGYGRAYDSGVMGWAHRVYYERMVGPIPEGLELDHLCTNPPCVNPDHLEPVTKTEHVRRTWERTGRFEECTKAANLRRDGLTYAEIAEVLGYAGRERAHEAVKSAIHWGLVAADEIPARRTLSDDEREDLRDLFELGVPQKELGRWYGLNQASVCRAIAKARREEEAS